MKNYKYKYKHFLAMISRFPGFWMFLSRFSDVLLIRFGKEFFAFELVANLVWFGFVAGLNTRSIASNHR